MSRLLVSPWKINLSIGWLEVPFYLHWFEGWEVGEKESSNDTLLRPLLIAMLGGAGSPEVVEKAKALFDRHYKAVMSCDKGDAEDTSAATVCEGLIPADLRVAVYSTCMRHGGDDVYERLLNVSTLMCSGDGNCDCCIGRLPYHWPDS